MKIGVQLPEVEREVGWPELRRMAELAERIGVDSIWVGDHLLYRDDGRPPRGPWEAWSLLAALAAVTRRVELGPLVASTSFHAPAMLAKKAATVDEISGGRLVLGLGAGWNRPDYDAFGFPYDHRVSRFEEAFAIIRALLTTGAADVRGTYYSVDRSELRPRGPRPKGPPLMVGSIGERMLGITLPHVASWNAWFTWFGNSVDGYRILRARSMRRVGRSAATPRRSSARSRCSSRSPAPRGASSVTCPSPMRRTSRATRPRWCPPCKRSPRRGSATCSWSSTRSPRHRSRPWSRRFASSAADPVALASVARGAASRRRGASDHQ